MGSFLLVLRPALEASPMREDILWWKGGEDIKRAQEFDLAADEDKDEAEEVEKVGTQR